MIVPKNGDHYWHSRLSRSVLSGEITFVKRCTGHLLIWLNKRGVRHLTMSGAELGLTYLYTLMRSQYAHSTIDIVKALTTKKAETLIILKGMMMLRWRG